MSCLIFFMSVICMNVLKKTATLKGGKLAVIEESFGKNYLSQ